MKIIKYVYKDQESFGLLEDQVISPLENDCKSFVDLIDANLQVKGRQIPLDQVEILSPIERPIRNIFCLGKNYKDHALEMKGKITDEVVIPDRPIYFSKACVSPLQHLGHIRGHIGISDQVDYEVELAVIISKDGINVSKEKAKEYIFGYTIANDISARDLQKSHYQWLKGKSLEGFCPLGPVIVTRESLAYPPDLAIRSYVNGQKRQDARTNQLIFDLDTIISDLSKGMTLRKGDIILTGTPSGVGMGFKPAKYLKSGDVITCEIEHIGILTNTLD